ncbi:MAG TPA: TaqI-like C-terminal specificity domain-containing protein [Bacteroidales bacterium]|nr:TaqI-like C-terminal specificity domain-containing protein [Bacteroidales bacterium]
MNKESGRKIIAERVEDFEKNKAILTKKGHRETNIRSNYIDIMFKALGWDMKSHYEVVREFSQRDKSTDGGTKKVDYAFKINGKLKFFIEAKEASVDLENDKSAIFQAKRYAYSSNGKAPIVILTDFEEFRVFNVIKAPLMDNTDRELLKSHTMRYTDYLEKWDILWDTFSREAVEKGSLDQLRGKIDKNTKTMDVDFLEQITNWRELLAKNIAIRNENLNVDEINEAVQRILDRLVFIRNLEDREIEPENTLLDKTKKNENIYKSLIPIFNSLNTTYNGLLFKKHFSEDIMIDDKTIKDIIREMCYPVSPFQFDVIEPEILGRIYEKFLGSKIELYGQHKARITEKIEVRKAGGVYYTPEYIVEYIVQNTVAKKIEGLSPSEIKEIKIVDPACGSGSFLIGAYGYLLDYHQKWYTENQKDKMYQADWYKTKDGEIKVCLEKRGDILINNIFGVDIDKEATEVSIMSLYLKMLDGGFDKGEKDLFFVKGSILPDMLKNIRCGNSLITTDYFSDKLDFNVQEMKEIKPFDWNKMYEDVFTKNGFDCVIGNPPYGADLLPITRDYLRNKYPSYDKDLNSFVLFVEMSLKILKKGGMFSFIIPKNIIKTDDYENIRKNILKNYNINYIYDCKNCFEKVTTEMIILVCSKGRTEDSILKYIDCDQVGNILAQKEINQSIFDVLAKNRFNICLNKNNFDIISKMELNCSRLGNLIKIYRGVETGKKDDFITLEKPNSTYKEIITGSDLERYLIRRVRYIVYNTKKINFKDESMYNQPKILIRKIADRIYATYDESNIYTTQGVYILNGDYLKLLLGIINSKLLHFYYEIIFNMGAHLTTNVTIENIKYLPIIFNPTSSISIAINNLVDQILATKVDLTNSKSESDMSIYEQKINLLDNKINELVYQLYNLTDDEIKIVEAQ